jgi:hypothetical protein
MYHQPESSQQRGDRLLREFQAQRGGIEPLPQPRPSTIWYAIELICVGPKRLLADMALMGFILFAAAAVTAFAAAMLAPNTAPPQAPAFEANRAAPSPTVASPRDRGAFGEAR